MTTRTWGLAEVTVTGSFAYCRPHGLGAYDSLPARNMYIELWDDDETNDSLLTSGYTRGDGTFTLGPVNNVESGDLTQDIYVVLWALCDEAIVGDSLTPTWDIVPLKVSSSVVQNVSHGTHNYETTTLTESQSGCFHAADVIQVGKDYWSSVRPFNNPGMSKVLLRPTTYYTSYAPTEDLIFIQPTAVSNQYFPDTFDRDVILHEFGHRLEYRFGFFDMPVTAAVPHTLTSILTPEQAACEAFAHWWCLLPPGSSGPIRYDSYGNFTDTAWFDLETGHFGNSYTTSTNGTVNCLGISNEGAGAGILWDLMDAAGDDGSCKADWGNTVHTSHSPDGIGDAVSIGLDNVLATLLDHTVDGHKPDHFPDLWRVLSEQVISSQCGDARDIWYEHGDSVWCQNDCCIGMRGDVNGTDGEAVNISDMTFLIAYLFRGGPQPPCMDEADVTGDGSVNVSDVTHTIAFLFRGGAAPPPCP